MLLFVQLVMLGAFKPQHKSTDAIVFHINMLALVQKLYLLLHYSDHKLVFNQVIFDEQIFTISAAQ